MSTKSDRLQEILRTLTHKANLSETDNHHINALINSLADDQPDEAVVNAWSQKSDDEVLGAAFSGDAGAQEEFRKRRESKGPTETAGV